MLKNLLRIQLEKNSKNSVILYIMLNILILSSKNDKRSKFNENLRPISKEKQKNHDKSFQKFFKIESKKVWRSEAKKKHIFSLEN